MVKEKEKKHTDGTSPFEKANNCAIELAKFLRVSPSSSLVSYSSTFCKNRQQLSYCGLSSQNFRNNNFPIGCFSIIKEKLKKNLHN